VRFARTFFRPAKSAFCRYSFGVLIWVLWTGRRDPYEHLPALSPFQLYEHIQSGGRPEFGATQGGEDMVSNTGSAGEGVLREANVGEGGNTTSPKEGGGGDGRGRGGGGGSSSSSSGGGGPVQAGIHGAAAMAGACWSGVPAERPSFDDVLLRLREDFYNT
jgi:hypothetical protein